MKRTLQYCEGSQSRRPVGKQGSEKGGTGVVGWERDQLELVGADNQPGCKRLLIHPFQALFSPLKRDDVVA